MSFIIKIHKHESKYEAVLINTETMKSFWKTVELLSEEELSDALFSLGFHQTDIFDAFNRVEGKSKNAPHPLWK